MFSRVCRTLLTFIGRIMLFALLIAAAGAFLLFFGLLFGGLAVWSASPSVAAALAAIFAHPVFGNLAGVGLVMFVGGLLLALAMLVLYVLVSVVCCSLALDAKGVDNQDACDCGSLCLLGPLFPAAAFLILILVIAPILLLGVGRDALGVTPNALLTAVAAMLGLFGLLLALAPVIWCCCKGCKCREHGHDSGPLTVGHGRAEAH